MKKIFIASVIASLMLMIASVSGCSSVNNDLSSKKSTSKQSVISSSESSSSILDSSSEISDSEESSSESSTESSSESSIESSTESSSSLPDSSSSSDSSSTPEPIDYGTLTIANVSVEYGKTATINPVFSTIKEDITYSYDTSKITISGNTVTGKVAESVVTVTATTAHLSTTFKVTVGKNYGTLTIANVSVEYGKTATINPVFSTIEEDITYSYDTSKITINGNTVTGKVAESIVTVTARTAHLSTTFTVTVGKNYGTLTIANVSVEYGKTATINPVFSTIEEDITYSYDTSKITINGNTVTGKVAESIVTVTATTAHLSTTFKVTVGKDYGTLTIADITTYNGFYAKATPVFSKTSESITYSFDTSKLSVSGNAFTGKSVGTFTVTAKTDHLSTTFNVTVKNTDYLDRGGYQNGSTGFLNTFDSFKNGLQNYIHDSGELAMFIGDSFFDSRYFFTDFYERFAYENAYTLGVSSSKADQWEWYIQKLYAENPRSIVIHIGTNDIFDGGQNANQVTETLKRLFNNIKENLPQTKVYWFSIEPRRGAGDANGNAIAVQVNNNIKSYLSTNKIAVYMDSYTFFNANQNDTYYRDTVHPTTPLGYNKLMEILSESGHTFVKNSRFDGKISDWTTSTSDNFSTSKTMYFASGKFLYTSTVTVNSTLTNGHVTLNFNNNAGTRFLLWNSASNGKFYFCGASASGYVNSSTNYANVGQTIDVAVLKAEKHAYLFIDGVLQTVYLNAPDVTSFTVGSESCVVSFVNNKVYPTNTSDYANYLAKDEVSIYQNSTDTTSKIIVDCSMGTAGIALDNFNTIDGTDVFGTSRAVNNASGKFVLGFDFNISSSSGNGHITINLNGSGDTRFLIWNSASDGKFYFGGINGSVSNVSKQYATIGSIYHADILIHNKNAYMFINGALQTVYTNVPVVSSLTLGSETCSVNFSNITIYGASSKKYTALITSEVTSQENKNYTGNSFIDIGTDIILKPISDWSTTTKDTFFSSRNIAGAKGSFLFKCNVFINSTNNNGHITINLNNTDSNRFLLWNSQGNGYFYYGGACNGNYVNSSKNFSSVGVRIEVAILFSGKNAYLFINGTLQTVFTKCPTIESLTVGSESCAVDFSNVEIYSTSSGEYQSKLNSVSSYENTNYTNSTLIDVKP